MEPPRTPQASDHAKRKQELEEAHKGDPVEVAMTPEQQVEADNVFRDF